MSVRHVRIGCTFVQVAQIDTPTVFQVEPVLGQIADTTDEEWSFEPEIASRSYADLYGNRCRRLSIPAGRSVISYRANVVVPDATEDCRSPGARGLTGRAAR